MNCSSQFQSAEFGNGSASQCTKALKKKKIPFREFILKDLSEEVIGVLFSYFIFETAIIGKLLNMNPFDQPAVELIKKEIQDCNVLIHLAAADYYPDFDMGSSDDWDNYILNNITFNKAWIQSYEQHQDK